MEEKIIMKTDVIFHGIHAGKFRRYFSFQNFIDWFKVPIGFVEALIILIRHRPKALFSKGGYIAVPVCFAAWALRIPVIIHDSDVVPGLASKLTGKIATRICISWEKSLKFFPNGKAVLTGIPVRDEIWLGSKENGLTFVGGITNELPILLVVGGSLGASFLNEFVITNIFEFTKKFNIVHLTGDKKEITTAIKTSIGWYKSFAYVDESYKDLLALSNVILSRSGATALAEFDVIRKPLVLVPLPISSSRGDQIDNAEEYAKAHPECRVIEQESITLDKILGLLLEVVTIHEKKTVFENTAVMRIVDILSKYC